MRIVICGAALLVLVAGCKKTEPVAPVAVKTTAPAAAPVAAPPAAAATPDAPAPLVLNSVPLVVADGVTYMATTGDGKDVVWALRQDEIKHDPDGQWASDATASSAWADAKDHVRFAAWQATGEPNVDQAGDNANAWAPKTADGGIEWLELTFPKAVNATGVRIRESENAGTVVKVELYDDKGGDHVMWQGPDPTRGLNYLEISFPKTAYKVNKVRVVLATNLVSGDNEIDAVQLLGK